MNKNKNLKVSVIMGSQSDYKTMKLTIKVLKIMGIKFETKIIPKRQYWGNNSWSRWISTSSRNDFSAHVTSSFGCAYRE